MPETGKKGGLSRNRSVPAWVLKVKQMQLPQFLAKLLLSCIADCGRVGVS